MGAATARFGDEAAHNRGLASRPRGLHPVNVLLVYPSHPDTFWSFKHVLKFVSRKSAFPPLGLLTVAAMLPREWSVRLVDTNVGALEDADLAWADYVFVSGMIVHKASAHEIAQRCAAAGKVVIAGGPLFTTGHRDFPEIAHFVLGEAEDVIGDLVADMQTGTVKAVYRGDAWPDVRRTPVPRWDLIDLRHYVTMPVQFSRGCPFDCEFCDIVVMNGRVPRTKSPAQLVAELDALRVAGWRDMVFIVDDNFIGNRKHALELSREIVAWRARTKASIGFLTEASINLADHPELCEAMVAAGFKKVFLGIETPEAESLDECGKRQNQKRDLAESIAILQRAGLEVMGGFIVGFDNDPLDICTRQFEFIQKCGVVTAMVGLLTALPQTRLYRRLAQEGRIVAETCGNNTDAVLNFVTRVDRDFIVAEYRSLMRRLYAPKPYYRRLRAFLRRFEPRGPTRRLSAGDLRAFLKSLWLLGVWNSGRRPYWALFWSTLLASPRKFRTAVELAILGYHFRKVAERL
jgi:radical SAM superfamily enzyme YgiQ (UPF0313 family)